MVYFLVFDAKMIKSIIELLCLFWASTFIRCIVINAKIIVCTNTSKFKVDDEEASFGVMIPSDGILGLLVVSKPLNACVPILPPPRIFPINRKHFFALVEESKCEYSHQTLMVQNAGYKGAIIYRKASNSLIKMEGGKDSDKVHIASVSIARRSGDILKRFDYTTRTDLKLMPSIEVPIGLYLIPFLVVFGVCFLFMAIFSLGRYCRYRSTVVNSRLSKQNLRCIPTKKFKKGDDYDICAICLDEFEVGDKLRVLPCSHVYHCKCIDPWLTGGKKSCPVCNQPVIIDKKSKQCNRTRPASVSSTEYNEQQHDQNNDDHNDRNDDNDDDDDDEPNERTPLISSSSSLSHSHLNDTQSTTANAIVNV